MALQKHPNYPSRIASALKKNGYRVDNTTTKRDYSTSTEYTRIDLRRNNFVHTSVEFELSFGSTLLGNMKILTTHYGTGAEGEIINNEILEIIKGNIAQ